MSMPAKAIGVAAASAALYFGPFLPNPGVWPHAFYRTIQTLCRREQDQEALLLTHVNLASESPNETNHKSKLSVIVPVYNEGAANLHSLVQDIREKTCLKHRTEIVLVNAGCTDDTFQDIGSFINDTKVVKSSPGRGQALRTGVDSSAGELLLFLHADSQLPLGYDNILRKALCDPEVEMCAFSFKVDNRGIHDRAFLKSIAHIERSANQRSAFLWLPYGDQAISMSRQSYSRLGGIQPYSMMEDFDLVTRARHSALKNGRRICILPENVLCSPRRWQNKGILATTIRNWFFVAAFVWGKVTPDTIYRWYYS
mmetsp:Transcript_8804/g.14290  ORF Transcript_8804/g.14290 Transcript_8804/m.14290 type:complete len:312 (-) Transcript_8804:2191-3126(-)